MYRRTTSSWQKHLDFIFLDLLCLFVTFIEAYGIRIGFEFQWAINFYINVGFVMLMIDIFVVFFYESYKGILRRGYWEEFKAVMKHCTLVMGILIAYLFVTKNASEYSRIIFVLHWASSIIVMYGVRLLWKHHILKKENAEIVNRTLVIVTKIEIAEEVVHTVIENVYGQIRIAGIVLASDDISSSIKEIEGISVVAVGRKDAVEYIRKSWVDEVLICYPKDAKEPEEFVGECMKMGVTTHIRIAECLNKRKQMVEKLGGYVVLSTSVSMADPRQLFAKRMMDICGALVGLVLTGIMLLPVAIMIYIKSPGKIIFAQERVGKNGKRFQLYKFRSMYLDAEERKKELTEQNEMNDPFMFKIENDPRIIGGKKGIGNFIRRTSLDEFPQFYNVLKGDMSLVGTRPPTVEEWEAYKLHHRKRLCSKPGITGLWQVSGRSNIRDFEEVVRLDMEYIENWSIGQDLKILLRTVKIVLKKDGSV